MKTVMQQAGEFIKQISKDDRICIIHDTDPDGVCSAAILAHVIKRKYGKKIDLALPIDKKKYGITANMIERIKKKNITILITCDFSPDHDPLLIKQMEKKHKILVFDHHKIYNDLSSERTVFCKPQLFFKGEPNKYCTAKLVYDSLSGIVDIQDLDWMAAAASIADIATEPWMDWIKKVYEKYNYKIKENLFDTELGRIASIVSSAETYDEKMSTKAFWLFSKSTKPKEIESSELAKYKKIIDYEIKKHTKLFEAKKESTGEMLFYQMKSKYKIQSVLSTLLALDHKSKTIVIINTKNPIVSVSARRGDGKKAVNALLEKSIDGFENANAGGHKPSAGAAFPRKYLNTFKQRILENE